MSKLKLDISMSLDGYVAGPDPSLDEPLGEGGEQLHEWALAAASWRESHGLEGGETNVDDELLRDHLASIGATIMGRKMFSGGEGSWENDPKADGWWGDDPPFHHPVFILTHQEREPVEVQGGTTFTFVSDGIESALEQAREAAGDKDVAVGGGAGVAQQYLNAGSLDELHLHIAPALLGGGVRLLDGVGDAPGRLKRVSAIESPTGVIHLKYRVVDR